MRRCAQSPHLHARRRHRHDGVAPSGARSSCAGALQERLRSSPPHIAVRATPHAGRPAPSPAARERRSAPKSPRRCRWTRDAGSCAARHTTEVTSRLSEVSSHVTEVRRIPHRRHTPMTRGETIHHRRDVSPLPAGITSRRRSATPRRRHVAPRSHHTVTRRSSVPSRAADVTSLRWNAVPLDVASAALAEQTGALLGGVVPRADRSPTLPFHVGGTWKRNTPSS